MRWDDSHESPDVVDRRGEPSAGPQMSGANAGGLIMLAFWLLRTPFGWVVVLAGIAFFAFRGLWGGGGDVAGGTMPAHGGNLPASERQAEAPEVHFVSFVLDDVQATWQTDFASAGRAPYRHSKLVLYTDATETGCGFGQAATGPFYCPQDERVYIDLGFFHELSGKLGARGQFAQAYVIAHELGHHIQKLLGISQRVDSARQVKGATGASVRLELQADCFAGVWAHSTEQRSILEAGDVESAVSAAAAVGDDRLQRMGTGSVRPESWTHGSSEERVRWFRRGYEKGTVTACDTFAATQL